MDEEPTVRKDIHRAQVRTWRDGEVQPGSTQCGRAMVSARWRRVELWCSLLEEVRMRRGEESEGSIGGNGEEDGGSSFL